MSTFMACDQCGRKVTGPYWGLGPWMWGGDFRGAKAEYASLNFETTECLYAWVAQHVQLPLVECFEPED